MSPPLIKKYLLYFLLILVAVSLVKVANTSGDFKIFLGAAQLISENKSPYHEWIFVSEGNLGLYYYSPLWAVILIPFNLIPQFITNLIWLTANVYFLYRIARFLISCTKSLNISQRHLNWILIIAAAMSFRFALYNFGMIQMTIFLLWGILESLNLIRKEKFLLAGMLLALVINIKLLPLVFIPYLIYRSEYKTLISAFIFSMVFLFLPAIVVGWSTNIFLHAEWWSVINPSNPEHLLDSRP